MKVDQISTAIITLILILLACKSSVCRPRDLQILWLFPRMDMEEFTLASSIGPLALAVEKVQADGLLHGHGVNITWMDSACDPKVALGNFVSYLLYERPDAVFGPPCTRAMIPVADLASFQNVPIFSWASNMPDLDNKTIKSTLVRAIAPLSSLGELLIFFCAQMDWSKVSMISTLGESPEGMASFYRQAFKDEENFYMVREFTEVKDNINRSDIERMYNVIKLEARIIILVIPKTEVRRYLVVAHDMGMTSGDYQFLYTERTVSDKAFLDEFTSRSFWQKGDPDDEKARQGYHNLLYFTYHYVTEWSLDTNQSMEAAMRVFGSDQTMPTPTPPDKFSRFLFDAFYLYALAFNDTVHRNQTPEGSHIFEASKNKFFQGQTGRFLSNNLADRQSSFLVWDMDENDIFQQVIVTRYTLEGKLTWDVNAPILWGNGRHFNSSDGTYIPRDTPVCGFFNENCIEENLTEKIAPSVVVLIMLAGLIAVLLVYRWWKNERMLYETVWKIKYTDLNFNIARGPISQLGISGTTGSQKSLNGCSDNRSESSTGNMSSSNSTMKHDNMLMISQMFTTVAKLNGDIVAVRKVYKKTIKEDKFLLKEMKLMKSLKHTNLATFQGTCTEAPNICVLWEYCSKGSLEDILHNTDIRLEAMFQFSIALDICTGLNYLHTSELEVHGRLKTTNCVIDSRWVAKLTDYGLHRFKKGEKPSEEISEEKYYTDLFWTAPEILRCILRHEKVIQTKEADIFSLGVVLKQLLCKNLAYNEELAHQTPKDIIMKIANPGPGPLVRPHIVEEFPEHYVIMMSFVHLINACWAEDPSQRPTIKKVLRKMKRMSPLKSSGVLDNMLSLMERYSNRLEDLVSERTLQLEEEKRKTDTLLYRMLPKKVADDLKIGHHVQAEAFTDVTIYFSDIVGFTTLASESTPMEIVEMLNFLYSQFDDIIQSFNVYKVETIGDAYMVVCGCPDPNPDHASVMADMSLTLLDSVIHFVVPHRPGHELRIRIGLNSGPVVAGVVGNTMPRYCLFGNTVNLASRMESQGLPQKIQVSFYTYEILKSNPDFIMEARGLTDIKGKGQMPTYWLTGRKSYQPETQDKSTNSKSVSPVNHQERDIEGSDGDVTKHHTLRQRSPSQAVAENVEIHDMNSGLADSACYKKPDPVLSPQKPFRQTSASSMSNTSCMSFENTQNTLTSITDIEETVADCNINPRIFDETTTGPNLNQCMNNVKDDCLHGIDKNISEREHFWTDHFRNTFDIPASNQHAEIQFQNNYVEMDEDDYNATKTEMEKDSFGMDCFVNNHLKQDVFENDLITDGNFCENSPSKTESLNDEISKDVLQKTFSENTDNASSITDTHKVGLVLQEKCPTYTSQNSIEDSSKETSSFTICGENLCKAKLNITQQSSVHSNYGSCNQQKNPEFLNLGSSIGPAGQKFFVSPLSPRYVTSYDDNSVDEMETDAFIEHPSIDLESGRQNLSAYDHLEDAIKFSSESNINGDTPIQKHFDEAKVKYVPEVDSQHEITGYDAEQYELCEYNPFIEKVLSPGKLRQNQSAKTDHYSRHSANTLANPSLREESSEKLLMYPRNKSHMIMTSWSDKTPACRNTQTCTDNESTHKDQLLNAEVWENSLELVSPTSDQNDDQLTKAIDV